MAFHSLLYAIYKKQKELELMRKASSMNDKMMEAVKAYIRPGIYESDIVRFVMNFTNLMAETRESLVLLRGQQLKASLWKGQ